MEQNL